MRQRMSEFARQRDTAEAEPRKAQQEDPLEELRRNIQGRGEEVMDAAMAENPELVRQVASALVKAIREGKVEAPLEAGDLLILFRRLGLKVKVESRLMVEKKGEIKDLRKVLEESWRGGP
jgi:DNA-binding TFAR19-related protein (PDSD5 family)